MVKCFLKKLFVLKALSSFKNKAPLTITKSGTPIRDIESTIFPQINSGDETGKRITNDALMCVIKTVMIATVFMTSKLLFQLFFSDIKPPLKDYIMQRYKSTFFV